MSKYFTRLDNGMRIVTEQMLHVESISLGVWLNKGSRFEAIHESGMFHFIEHTLFKGTPRLSARQIAEAFDGIGGSLDAYTGKEETCFSFRLRAKHLNFGLEILSDLLQAPVFDPQELDRERQVILEEIKMAADDPEDLAFESALQAFWHSHALGRPILGTRNLVAGFQTQQVKAFHARHYQPQHIIIAAAGQLEHQAICEQVQTLFQAFPKGHESMGATLSTPCPHGFRVKIDRPHLEQATFCLMFPGVSQRHEEKLTLALLSTLFGGGMSSRLFQTIREKHGLAYSIGSFSDSFSDGGYLVIYGSCAPENLGRVLDLIIEEIQRLKRDGVDRQELNRAREQCVGGMVLAMEHSSVRAGALAKTMHYANEIFDLKKKMAAFSKVTPDRVNQLSRQLLQDDCMGISVVGPIDKHRLGVTLDRY